MSSEISIRIANELDIPSLVAFNTSLASETENLELDPEAIKKGVAAVFADKSKGFYLVAEDPNNNVMGCLMVTNEWSDWRNTWFWWIMSVYVLPEARGKKVYSQLYEFVKKMARKQGDVSGFRLYVDINNTSAQKVYEKVGMQASHYLLFGEDS